MGKGKGNLSALRLCRNSPAGTSHTESSLPMGQSNVLCLNAALHIWLKLWVLKKLYSSATFLGKQILSLLPGKNEELTDFLRAPSGILASVNASKKWKRTVFLLLVHCSVPNNTFSVTFSSSKRTGCNRLKSSPLLCQEPLCGNYSIIFVLRSAEVSSKQHVTSHMK